MPPRRKVAGRCIFPVTETKDCRLAGYGDPPLCPAHEQSREYVEEMLEEEAAPAPGEARAIVEHLLERPEFQGLLGKFATILDKAAERLDSRNVPPPSSGRPGADPGRTTPRMNARAILHFGPQEPLSAGKIKERKKILAQMAHPDRGGSHEAMSLINDAADALLAELK